ncbi:hypothetical protein [Devosia sp. SL43]|uniref:hypothetical protein n=1 Tax=Devosia sp. SL43 TaxID=2806348 RepID=UPI001F25557C|nr:hypothetical protein [Devosia sp. SL43]UJW86212.1 hypothetical protein IM737_02725 [Devosia sp. SL43]
MTAPLGPRTIRAYRRFAKPLAALMKVTRGKAAGPVGATTVARCNALIVAANRLFAREPDIGRLPPLPAHATLSAIDLALVVDELTIATLRFEERYPELDSHKPPPLPR